MSACWTTLKTVNETTFKHFITWTNVFVSFVTPPVLVYKLLSFNRAFSLTWPMST